MKLLTHELKQFKANAAFVKQNDIIPVLRYLLIEAGSITKNNLNSFCKQAISYTGESFLIEEAVLMSAVDDADGEIEVTIKGNEITLSSNGMKWKSQSEMLEHYPLISKPSGEVVKLSNEVLEQISIASNFVDENASNPAATMVFISGENVTASNGFIAYKNEIETGLENTYLPKQTCVAIKGFDELNFQQSDSYHFFSNDSVMIGISKPEYKYIDISTFFKLEATGSFEIEKAELIQFNNQAIKTASSKLYTTLMKFEGDNLELTMVDNDYKRGAEKTISVTGAADGEFKYNPEFLNRILKSLPNDTVTIHQTDGKYFVTTDAKTISLIMQIN